MRDFLVGFVLAGILGTVLLGLITVDYQRKYRLLEQEAYSACEDSRQRAQEFGKERNALWREISRLKR